MNENKKDIKPSIFSVILSWMYKITSGKNKLYAVSAIIAVLIMFSVIIGLIIFKSGGKPENSNEIIGITETENLLELSEFGGAVPVWAEEDTKSETETETETITTEIITEEPATETAAAAAEEPTVKEPVTEEIFTTEPLPEGPLKTLVLPVAKSPAPVTASAPAASIQIIDDSVGGEKFIALTFDDGPSPDTERLLDILTENGSKATFFVVGYKISSYEQTIKNIVGQGSEIGGHSWNHPQLTRLSDENIRQELQATNTALFNITGIYPQICRVPYGSFNDRVKNISKELGLAIIQWNIDPRDWSVRNADSVYNNIMSAAKDGGIVCMHDTHPTTIDAMERVIPDLIAAGYKLITVSELLQYAEPGNVYYSGK